MIFLFLTSGLFLGWSLGANDASNIFGSAVGSKMVSFIKAAALSAAFVILGSVAQGSGATETLSKLGAVDAIAGAFTVALSAALTVFLMTKYALPVSTSQAIVGAIIGWNLYTGNPTDFSSLWKIVLTWFLCPLLSALFSIISYLLFKYLVKKIKPHLLSLDNFLRISLIVVGSFGAYSLGANNIANVMGVFVTAISLPSIDFGIISLSGPQQLFLVGGIAISSGIITYSKKTMMTVGNSIMELSSEMALIVVLAHSIVLFVFSSSSLNNLLTYIGLPNIPMVPVSSTQAIVGAIIGIGLLKGGRDIKFSILGEIVLGWVSTPVIACIIVLFSLFFVNNVFKQNVSAKDFGKNQKNTLNINNQIDTFKNKNTETENNENTYYKAIDTFHKNDTLIITLIKNKNEIDK